MLDALVASGHPFCVALLVHHLPWRAGVHVFVLKLDADDGATVSKKQALHLPANLGIQALETAQVAGVVGAHFKRLAVEPIRQAAVAPFAMRKWADAQNHLQAMPGA